MRLTCPSCAKLLEADDALVGRAVRCPACGEVIALPAARTEGPPAASEAPTSACPNCGRDMGPRAVICVMCGYDTRTGEVINAAAATEMPEELGALGPHSRPRRRSGPFQGRKLVWLLVGVGALVLLGAFLLRSGPDPTVTDETREEKQAAVAEAFGEGPAESVGDQTAEINAFFADLGQAFLKADAAAIGRLFDSEMTFAALEKQGLLPAQVLRNRERVIQGLDQLLPAQMARTSQLMSWTRHEIRRVQFLKGREEALVYVKLRNPQGVTLKQRWWIIRRKGAWRAYDFEDLNSSIRWSTSIGGGIAAAATRARWGPSVNTLARAAQLVAQQQLGQADALLRTIGQVKFPDALEAQRWMIVAVVRTAQQRYGEALKAIGRAESYQADMPILHFLRLESCIGIEDYGRALESGHKYVEQIGGDAETYGRMAWAHKRQGNQDKAMEYCLKGLRDDPQSVFCFIALVMILPDDRKPEAAPHFDKLGKPDVSFRAVADALLEEKDAAALKALIGLFRKKQPESPLADEYDRKLKKLEKAGPQPAPKKALVPTAPPG